MHIIITLAFCVLVSFLFTYVARKLRLSVVVGLIVGGLIIGSSFLETYMISPNTDVVLALGDLGIIFLMFLTGLNISWSSFRKEGKDAAIVSTLAALTPFFLSTLVFFFIFGLPLEVSLIIGITMSITAEASNARVLMEMRKLKTRLGSLMMGAGIIDDMIGISLFLVVGYLFTDTIMTREFMMLFVSIAAFFIGIVVNNSVGKESPKVQSIENVMLLLVVPFFFIAMGIEFSLQALTLSPLLIASVIIVAVAGKLAGSMLARPFLNLSTRQLYIVGWGMNARSEIGLAIAFIAFKVGLLGTDIYSSLVIMALVTTLIFPFFLRREIRKNPGIMDS